MLHQLGLSLGHEEWCADWARQRVAPSPPPPPPAAAASVAASAASTSHAAPPGATATKQEPGEQLQQQGEHGAAEGLHCKQGATGAGNSASNVNVGNAGGPGVAEGAATAHAGPDALAAAPPGPIADMDSSAPAADGSAGVTERASTQPGGSDLDGATPPAVDQEEEQGQEGAEGEQVEGRDAEGGLGGGSGGGGVRKGPAEGAGEDADGGAEEPMASRRRECAAVVDRIRHVGGGLLVVVPVVGVSGYIRAHR